MEHLALANMQLIIFAALSFEHFFNFFSSHVFTSLSPPQFIPTNSVPYFNPNSITSYSLHPAHFSICWTLYFFSCFPMSISGLHGSYIYLIQHILVILTFLKYWPNRLGCCLMDILFLVCSENNNNWLWICTFCFYLVTGINLEVTGPWINIFLYIFKCRNGLAPEYLAELFSSNDTTYVQHPYIPLS